MIQGYKDTGIQGYRDIRIQGYRGIGIQGYRDAGKQRNLGRFLCGYLTKFIAFGQASTFKHIFRTYV